MDETLLYLVFEFVPMDLKKFIDSRPKKHLAEILTKSFTYQVPKFKDMPRHICVTKVLTFHVIVISGYILLSCKANIA